MSIRFGRAITGHLEIAETYEWLVTNGIGGYASGTIAGSLARGYHGLLVAATRPPTDRRIVLVKLDETVQYAGSSYELGCNRWASGTVSPFGHHRIQSFELERTVPSWRYACADALIDKRVWMEQGASTTYVSYTVVAASGPVGLGARTIVDNRVFHNTGQVNRPSAVHVEGDRARIEWSDPASPTLRLGVSSGDIKAENTPFYGFQLPGEARRGLRDTDDHVHAATLEAVLASGDTLVVVASVESDAIPEISALNRQRDHEDSLLALWQRKSASGPANSAVVADDRDPLQSPPPVEWDEQLVLAADQLIVSRPTAREPDGKSVIAGYHWFEDWGRDTMISLPGLALSTGRPEVAAGILKTFARLVSRGMLPNRFPDGSSEPEYNTIDATLWFFQAIAEYHNITGDRALLQSLFPVLRSIVQAHVEGTRYGIKVDGSDGLLQGGESSVQLTWMDAKVGDLVITPRIGKPVEVNALWYNALRAMERFATALGEPVMTFRTMAEQALQGFQRFWNAETSYCHDVLDGPDGNESELRPNQLLAVSLPDSPLSEAQQRFVVDACAGTLLTSNGLRSLAPHAPGYRGRYGGDQRERDGAYHQGTVWGWLIGPFVAAHLRVYDDPVAARRFLEPLADNLREAGLGTIGEIFEGDAPFAPRGCIAQAWSVGEVLRVLERLKGLEGER
jgi:predicted glycogen debranching enzyme